MPEPLLATSLIAGYALLLPLASRSTAVSADARVVADSASGVLAEAESAFSLFGAKQATMSQLAAAAGEAAEEDWDGYGASQVLDAAIWGASAFIRALPAYVPMPEFSVDPDGEVSMEWIADRDRIFSISFGRSSRVTYAGLDGTDRWRGTEYFDGETVHPFLLRGIERIMG